MCVLIVKVVRLYGINDIELFFIVKLVTFSTDDSLESLPDIDCLNFDFSVPSALNTVGQPRTTRHPKLCIACVLHTS